MRIALISDVHANIVALEAVLEAIDKEGVDRIIHAGDIVGYYPFPNEVIRIFQQRGVISIRGNHDRAALNICDCNMNPMASVASRWTAKHLDLVSIDYLDGLRDKMRLPIEEDNLAVHHGSPSDRDRYVYEEDVDGSLLSEADATLLVLGHTHIPFVRVTDRGIVVNPGSVGQPRDRDNRASWMLFDTRFRNFRLHRVPYDIERVRRAVEDEGLPKMIGDRLLEGR